MNQPDSFRHEVREWLEENCPQSMRAPLRSEAEACWGGRNYTFLNDDQRLWLERMAERGWTAPTWPREFGGGGLDREQNKILKEELARIHARPPLISFGISMLGPALLKFGSEELQARCEDRGDHFILNGSKIWTSYGDLGDWMFCLVRTDTEAPKHNGISFVMFDMATPGVSTRPIRLISGKSPFTETFFADVRVEKDQVIGELNQGWTVAKYLLTHEREMIGGSGLSSAGTAPVSKTAIQALGTDNGMLSNTPLRADIARFEIDERCLELTIERARDEVKAGVSLGASASMFKYYGTELNMRRQELLMAIGGYDGLVWEGDASHDGHTPRAWLRSKGNSIEGGTSEIQLNIVAKHILGLPG
jgi:alkylation response protein AidB-like acyl-CoA dehydrogenase